MCPDVRLHLIIISVTLAAGCATPARSPAPIRAEAGSGALGPLPRYARSGGGVARAAPAHPIADDTPDLDRALERRKVTLHFDRTPLEEALRFIQDTAGLNVAVSASAQERLEQERPTVTLHLRDVSVKSALHHVLASQDGLVGEIRRDMIVVTTRESVKRRSVVTFYEVGDLLSRRPSYDAPDIGLPEPGKGMKGAIIGFPKEEQGSTRITEGFDGDRLVALIERLVTDEGGSVELIGTQLMVRTTPSAHRVIAEQLAGLRGG